MKLLTTLLSIVLLTIAVNAQTNVVLNIEHRLNEMPFAFNTSVAAPGGYEFDVTRLQYYISGISLVHDGGQTTVVEDTWLLVDAGNDVNFDLGSHSVTVIEGIIFYIGVGMHVNNEDPSLWSAGHPLAPQNPSMHWGWASGYRFVAIEGSAGANTAFEYEVHALGNSNYNRVEVTTEAIDNGGNMEIRVYADYAQAFRNVDVSSGLILHSTTGDAVQFLDDFADYVFSPAGALGVKDAEFEGTFDLYPNPTVAESQISFQLPENEKYDVVVYGLDGRVISSNQLTATVGTYRLPALSSGAYSVVLEQNGSKVVTRKWVVTK